MRAKTAVVAGVLAVGVVGLVPPPAMAVGGTAPDCIGRRLLVDAKDRDYVFLTNDCHQTMRVRVIWDRGSDSRCYDLEHRGYVSSFKPNPLARYNRTVTC